MKRKQRKEYDSRIAGVLKEYFWQHDLTGVTEEKLSVEGTLLQKAIIRRTRIQAIHSISRAAAVFLIVLLAGFGTVCAASPEVRAAVKNTWNQLFDRWNGEFEQTEPVKNGPANYYQVASCTDEKNDWYYAITLIGMPGNYDQSIASFIGIDLRHRYGEDCWNEAFMIDRAADGSPIYIVNSIRSSGIWFGMGSEAEKRDRKLIQEILEKVLNPEISGDPDPADYSFEVLDKEMFFGLLREALADAPDSWSGKERDTRLSTGVYVEPLWQDGYRFQIITAVRVNGIDEAYIDVLYQTGEAYNAYGQLSDLVEAGDATAQQQELFDFLQEVRSTVKDKDSFIAAVKELGEKKIEGVDFSRLIAFLKALEEGEEACYQDNPPDLPWKKEIISKEEWEERKQIYGIKMDE